MVAAPSAFLFEPERKWYPYAELAYEKWEDKVKRIAAERASAGAVSTSSDAPSFSRTTQTRLKSQDEELDDDSDMAIVQRIISRRQEVLSKAVPISLNFATNKAKMGGKAVYASHVRRRVRSAVSLIVTHGAKAKEEEGSANGAPSRKKLVYDLEEVEQRRTQPGNGWILKGWTYLVFPTLQLYRMPIPDLVSELREALQQIYKIGSAWEAQWIEKALPPDSVERQSKTTIRQLHDNRGGSDKKELGSKDQLRPRHENRSTRPPDGDAMAARRPGKGEGDEEGPTKTDPLHTETETNGKHDKPPRVRKSRFKLWSHEPIV
ncbi:hypothetical protein CC2G_014922 [Coprinopsis cinerea AmutBmut pab1-1]|nr:hypothetical protein CC2G_014922 [Coprinopsis cinerea AmutBmut pab1-1]